MAVNGILAYFLIFIRSAARQLDWSFGTVRKNLALIRGRDDNPSFTYGASWCNGSTNDSGSFCQGSSPCEAANHSRTGDLLLMECCNSNLVAQGVTGAPTRSEKDFRSECRFPRVMPAFFLSALAVVLLLVNSITAQGADDWQIVKVGDRDYLTFDNVARFYALESHPRLADNRLVLGDSRVRLEVCSNPREIYVNGVKQWLSFPVINQNGQLLVSRFDLAKTIEPCLRPTMITNLRPFRTVVLDAGHGGQDGGGHSMTGLEKDYTLDVIRDLKKALENRGLNVILTRDTDTYLSLEDRAERANETPDAILVSIHFNSGDATAAGAEVYAMTPRGAASTADGMTTAEQFKQMPGNNFDDASLALGTCVHHSLLGHMPQTDRGVKRARFAVLRLSHTPAILVEGGFLTNASESQKINDTAWRQKLADAIAVGVQSYQEVASYKQPPKVLADYRAEQLPLTGTIMNPAMITAVPPAMGPSEVRPVSNQMR